MLNLENESGTADTKTKNQVAEGKRLIGSSQDKTSQQTSRPADHQTTRLP